MLLLCAIHRHQALPRRQFTFSPSPIIAALGPTQRKSHINRYSPHPDDSHLNQAPNPSRQYRIHLVLHSLSLARLATAAANRKSRPPPTLANARPPFPYHRCTIDHRLASISLARDSTANLRISPTLAISSHTPPSDPEDTLVPTTITLHFTTYRACDCTLQLPA